MNVRGVIFDLDGTLVHSTKEWHKFALIEALSSVGYTLSSLEHDLYYDGLPTMKKLEMLTDEISLPVELYKKIFDKKQEITIDLINSNMKEDVVVSSVIKELRDRKKYKLGVCTNAIRETTELILKKSNLYYFFDSIVTNEDVSKAKPDPEGYVKSMRQLSIKPENTVILEDNKNGVAAALATNAVVIRVNSPNDLGILRGLINV